MKKIKVIFIVLLIIGILPFAILLLANVSVRKIDKDEYEKYLINTYGDLNFEYVPKGSCDWINGGACSYYFTTPELNGKTFEVYGSFGVRDVKIFKDTYTKTKYDTKLKQHYNTYFKPILKNGVEIKSINLDYEYENNIPNMSFDNYLKYIEDKNVEIILRLNIKLDKNNKLFNIKKDDSLDVYERLEILEKASQELNKFIYSNYDIDNLKLEVNNIVFSNNLNNIKEISIIFDGCKKDVYYATCNETIELYNK